ncbi:MAG: 4Fe-4S binding protein [Candidatus Kapabacteria bacterium]|nr:4Fe-4S binding protein [Candidatus Kapabacteria bacterium]
MNPEEVNSKSNSRRDFLKGIATVGAGVAGLSYSAAYAGAENILSEDRFGALVDTTLCVGCRHCEWACAKAHKMPVPEIESFNNRKVFQEFRRPSNSSLTVVNEFENPKNRLIPINVKQQCMHCDRPACVSACIVGAFSKTAKGPVVWDSDKCIGCRYCMVACPFQVPTFDYEKAIQPMIYKCDFCAERQKGGDIPACVDICPVEAITFGPRSELIREARNRIKRKPEVYLDYIYGEYEAGGTSWLYLASKIFTEIGFPKLSQKAAPGVSESIQHGIFAYFIPPASLYALLGGLMWMSKMKKEIDTEISKEIEEEERIEKIHRIDMEGKNE